MDVTITLLSAQLRSYAAAMSDPIQCPISSLIFLVRQINITNPYAIPLSSPLSLFSGAYAGARVGQRDKIVITHRSASRSVCVVS